MGSVTDEQKQKKIKQATEIIQRTRTRLILDHPFFGQLSLRLRLKPVTHLGSMPLPTMATDGKMLFFNPEFVIGLKDDPAKLLFSVAHETMHCAMGHPWRGANHEMGMRKLYAADMAINPLVRDAGSGRYGTRNQSMQPIDGAVFPSMFDLEEGLSYEDYYHAIPKDEEEQKRKGGQGQGNGEGDGTGHCAGVVPPQGSGDGPGDEMSEAEMRDLECEWQIATAQAAQSAKAAGKLPGSLEQFIEDMFQPSVDWKDVLRQFITAKSKDDFRMFPPNRRFIHSGLYLPSLNADDAMGEIVIAVDTSGSVGDHELAAFLAEINGICEDVRPRIVHLVECDHQIAAYAEVTPDQYPLRAKRWHGRGGTAFQPVFDLVEDKQIEPACMVYLTDMYPFEWPSDAPHYPVLWVATTDVVGPWGETIRMQVPEEQM